MSNELSIFESNAPMVMPSYLANLAETAPANLDSSSAVPALSIRGKVFRIVLDGEERPVTRFDADAGEAVPVGTMSLIVLNQGPFGARVYYDGVYSPDNNAGPICFSLDGKSPDARASTPQATSCAACPHSVKGSKITPSGAATTSCQLQRRLAVVPATTPDAPALLLRLAPTSAYDPTTKGASNNWFGWKQYMEFISTRGIRHTAQIVTKVRFDASAEHPKLLFRPERFITEEESKIIVERIASDEVNALIHPSVEAPVAKIAHAPGAAIFVGDDDADEPAPAPAPEPAKTAPKRKPAPAPVAAVAPSAEAVGNGIERKVVAAKTPPAPAGAGIEALLDDWDV